MFAGSETHDNALMHYVMPPSWGMSLMTSSLYTPCTTQLQEHPASVEWLNMTEFRDGSFSDEALKCLARKREVNKAETLFEITGQFPSPSKDFCQLKITSEGVIWRRWKISIRGVNHGTAPTPMPIEEVLSYEDYQYHNVLQVFVCCVCLLPW